MCWGIVGVIGLFIAAGTGPAAAANGLSEGCARLNDPFFDGTFSEAGFGGQAAFLAGDRITIVAGPPVSFGEPTSIVLEIPTGTPVVTADFPGTLTHTFTADVATNIYFLVDTGIVTWDVSCEVGPAAIATNASAGGPVGTTSVTDSATVFGGTDPAGDVTFNLYSDDACSSEVFTSTNALSGGSATSGSFTPTSPGTYYWIATYNGDANNNAVSGSCGDAGESVTITKATPTIATVASTGGLVGTTSVTDTATVSGGSSPNGDVTFRLFSDDACSSEVFSSTNALAGGSATSGSVTPTAHGTYYWIATYNGDANNEAVSGSCGDPGESVTILGLDFGDAPNSYGTLLGSDGARHVVTGSGPVLGSVIDEDADGLPTAGADGDDTTGSDDEDGVVLGALSPATTATAAVTASAPGLLDAFVDFNGDGDFTDPGEQVATGVALAAESNSVSFAVPATARPGSTYARFRISTAGGLGPVGLSADGEVEDHVVEINSVSAVCAGPPCGAIVGNPWGEFLLGTPGDDIIFGLGGDDFIYGRGGNDLICGGEGDNALAGDAGYDYLDGGSGINTNDGGTQFDYCVRGTNTNCP